FDPVDNWGQAGSGVVDVGSGPVWCHGEAVLIVEPVLHDLFLEGCPVGWPWDEDSVEKVFNDVRLWSPILSGVLIEVGAISIATLIKVMESFLSFLGNFV